MYKWYSIVWYDIMLHNVELWSKNDIIDQWDDIIQRYYNVEYDLYHIFKI